MSDDKTLMNVELIRASGLFDQEFYTARAGAEALNPIEHYLERGEAEGIPPSQHFDPEFYRQCNPDVARAGGNLLVHYLRWGRAEGRYPNRAMLLSDVADLGDGGIVNPPAEASALPPIPGLSPIERYLSGLHFDTAFYRRVYEDVPGYGKSPILHYFEVGRKQRRPFNQHHLSRDAAEIQSYFDSAYYRRNAGLPDSVSRPIEHYLTVGRFRGFDPSPVFSVAYYLNAYPDIAENGVEPFTHYLRHGADENRIGVPDFAAGLVSGVRAYDPDRATVLVVNHAASRTGAPLVGLETARNFSENHNIFAYCMGGGELVDEFAKVSVQVNVGPANSSDAEYLLRHLKARFDLRAVILNSAETSPFASAALYAGIPSVALMHEFAEYTLPPGRTSRMIAAADRVVVPAQLVLESVQREVKTQFGAPANNIVVRPQGCLPSLPPRHKDKLSADLSREEILAVLKATGEKKPPIVLGAGFVHMRKGIELFVQAAHEVRRRIEDVKFVWVGDGYLPRADTGYSVWIAEMVRRLELENTVFFLPTQSQLDHLFELCDAFFLSSRLDPFPSVVLDALEAGKQVVCFDRATGAAELFQTGDARGAVVEYANVPAAAAALVEILGSSPEDAARINRSVVERQFGFSDYTAFLGEQVELAQAARAKANDAVERILSSQSFDSEFFAGGMVLPFNIDRPCRDYVAQGVKGLAKFSPRPGFNDGLYRHSAKISADEVPFDHALRHAGAAVPATHSCILLDTMGPRPPVSLRAALHLHLFYPELANEFLGRLNAFACPIDLFVTTTDEAKQAELEAVFSSYAHGKVTYFQAPNRGRDIGPFITSLEAPLAAGDYDVVGHLHGKRSLAVDAAMGNRWRTYLLDTLLGPTFPNLLGLFADDDRLGLVFAEDRHAAGWNDNYEIARGLAQRIEPPLDLPGYPYFPLGTMFWARRAALAPLWRLGLQTEDFPPEPLSYDGTVLHAIERILPACCEAAGFNWCTVYDRRTAW